MKGAAWCGKSGPRSTSNRAAAGVTVPATTALLRECLNRECSMAKFILLDHSLYGVGGHHYGYAVNVLRSGRHGPSDRPGDAREVSRSRRSAEVMAVAAGLQPRRLLRLFRVQRERTIAPQYGRAPPRVQISGNAPLGMVPNHIRLAKRIPNASPPSSAASKATPPVAEGARGVAASASKSSRRSTSAETIRSSSRR